MKKLVFLILALFLSSAVTLDLARAEKEEPTEPPPIFQTRIVNNETNPVPVKGDVAVSGIVSIDKFPETQKISGEVSVVNTADVSVTNTVVISGTVRIGGGDVSIGNLPAVQSVEVTNLPDKPVFVADALSVSSEPVQIGVKEEDLSSKLLFIVPVDRRLLIQYISIRETAFEENKDVYAELVITLDGVPVTHFLEPFSGPFRDVNDPHPTTIWLLAQSLSLYADPGSDVVLDVFGKNTSVGSASLAGILEPIEP